MSGEGFGQNTLADALSSLARAMDRFADTAMMNGQIVDVNRSGVEYIGLLAGYLATIASTAPGGVLSPQNGGTGVANAAGETITLSGAFATSGAFTLTLTVGANTNVTLPASGTLATLAGAETLTNKTVSGPSATMTGAVTAFSGTAPPAAGAGAVGLKVSSTANMGFFVGSGAPTFTAAKGSYYARTDGSTTNDRGYIATDSAGAWTAVITAT